MLRNFNVDENNLSGPWPNYWNDGTFDNFISLRASWNNFHSDQLHGFENLTSLRVFVLTGSDITGTLPPSVNQLSNAIILSLAYTDIGGELPQSGWDFHQLRQIRFHDTKLTGHIPGDFFDAADNSDLRWLYLQNNNFTSVDREALHNVSSPILETINVSGNNF
jgi:Leucine-rich repeat (LRR) protein